MKKTLLSALAIGIALGVTAAPEKVLELQLADQNGLVSAATKLGEYAGNASLGAMAVVGLANAPSEVTNCCGKSQLSLYIDAEGKAQLEDVIKTVDQKYEAAPALASGRVLRVNFTKKGVDLLARAVEEAAKEAAKKDKDLERKDIACAVDLLKSLGEMTLTLGVTDGGLDIEVSVLPVPGTELAKVGDKSLSGDALAFAGKGALYALAYAADCGTGSSLEQYAKLKALLDKIGIKTGGFIKKETVGVASKFTLDIPALVSYAQGEGKAVLEKLVADEAAQKDLVSDLSDIGAKQFKAAGPEMSAAFYVNGVTTAATASQRFAKAMPEAAGKKSFSVGVFSFYGIVKGVAEQVVNLPCCGNAECSTVKGMLQTMPSDADAAIAGIGWKEGGKLYSLIRFTPAEIKGLYTVGTTLAMMGIGDSSRMDIELEDDDDDDED